MKAPDTPNASPAEDQITGQTSSGHVRRQILLLSPYDAYSHQQWRHTLTTMFPEWEWTVLTLPPRYFAWRVRGNSLSWAMGQKAILQREYDLLICTSLTDLSGLRGLLPSLARIPTLVYFHENQFAYPTNGMTAGPDDKLKRNMPASSGDGIKNTTPASVEAAMLSLYTALCADRVLFNSRWNYQSFVSGCKTLLSKLPDHVPPGVIPMITEKSHIQAVPLPDALFERAARFTRIPTAEAAETEDSHPLNIVWNHRHEYDKGPALLLAIVQRLVQSDLPFRLHLLGQRFRQRPDEFTEIESMLEAHYQEKQITPGLNQWLQNREDYLAHLQTADVVLSTALHDFQGLAIQEACIMGCLPLVPDALAYPEFIPANYRYNATGSLAEQAESAVERIFTLRSACLQPVANLPVLDFSTIQASLCRDQWLTHFNKLL